MHDTSLTYVGGPTAILEVAGLRFLTDPTFDDKGTDHPAANGAYVLRKTTAPAIAASAVGRIDAVLLSHDHHADNLDRGGRSLLSSAGRVLTTIAGAERLGLGAKGMAPWESITVPSPTGDRVEVIATPARHGPAGGDRGPVIGFVIRVHDAPVVYVTGDTVWYEGVAEVARRYPVPAVVGFFGAAKVAVAGPSPLTLNAADGIEVARAFPQAVIVPLHFEGWEHFSEGRDVLEHAFRTAGLGGRLRWPRPGKPISLRP